MNIHLLGILIDVLSNTTKRQPYSNSFILTQFLGSFGTESAKMECYLDFVALLSLPLDFLHQTFYLHNITPPEEYYTFCLR